MNPRALDIAGLISISLGWILLSLFGALVLTTILMIFGIVPPWNLRSLDDSYYVVIKIPNVLWMVLSAIAAIIIIYSGHGLRQTSATMSEVLNEMEISNLPDSSDGNQ